MSFQKSNALDSCSVFLRHIPARVASVVTRSLVENRAPIALPYVDAVQEAVVADIHISNLHQLFKVADFSADDRLFFENIIRAVARTGGDLVSLTPQGIKVVWSSADPVATTSKELLSFATVCTFEVQEMVGKGSAATTGSNDAPATVKAGIAMGRVAIVHAGGRNGHKRHVVVGGPAYHAAADGLRLAGAGEVAVCPESFKVLQENFQHRAMRQRFYVLLRNRDALKQARCCTLPIAA